VQDRFVLLSVACILAMVMLVSWARIDAEKAPRFVVGQAYSFAIDCNIRQTFDRDKDGTPVVADVSDCYQEPLLVRRVLEDGWLEVVDLRDERPKPVVWTVNPARMWGFVPIQNPHQKVAMLDASH